MAIHGRFLRAIQERFSQEEDSRKGKPRKVL
jgi:hypothetical protein